MIVVPVSQTWLIQITILLLMGAIAGVENIKILDLQVPTRVKAGIDVSLSCHFDLEEETLYSLNWWKGTHQFYQYSPAGSPHQIIYETNDIRVNKRESSLKTVVLRNVSVSTSGIFKCEVVADFPSYSRDSRLQSMEVAAVPDSAPEISIWKSQYEVGEHLNANCSVDRTNPASTILWYINGKNISVRKTVTYAHKQQRQHGYYYEDPQLYNQKLINAVSFDLKPAHFIRGGRAVLTCVALIPDLYRSTAEVHLTLPGVPAAEPSQRVSASGITIPNCFQSLSMGMTSVLWGILQKYERTFTYAHQSERTF